MANRWTLTVRNGPRVTRTHFDTLGETLDALERRMDELAPEARRRSLRVGGRRYDPVRQVAVRGELAGPGGLLTGGARGGVDLHGDGSAEAYLGRVKRRPLHPRPGESAYDALRRELGSP